MPCSCCSTKGIIYGFDITQDGKLDAKLRPYSDDLRDFPLVTLVVTEMRLGKEKTKIFLQNGIEYKN